MRGIERYYTDRATIMRRWKTVTEHGETRQKSLETVYEKVPCRISQKELSINNQSEPANEISYEVKLFISPSITIMQGDVVEITRGSSARKFKAGEPFLYSTHQEVILQRLDRS